MANHTPGPWAVMDTATGALGINASSRVPIGTVGGMAWHLGEETARANARLIAAAPDMLAALQGLAWAVSGIEYVETEYAAEVAQAHAAIAKALGHAAPQPLRKGN